MNKSELAEALAEKVSITKIKAAEIVSAIFDGEDGIITSTLKSGGEVSVQGFGAFKSVERKAREARNLQTGAVVQVAAKKVPTFKAGKNFKLAVKG